MIDQRYFGQNLLAKLRDTINSLIHSVFFVIRLTHSFTCKSRQDDCKTSLEFRICYNNWRTRTKAKSWDNV